MLFRSVDTQSSDNMMYLPLDRLTNRSGANTGNQNRSGGSGSGDIDIKTLSDQVIQELRGRQDTGVRRSR